MNTSMLSSIKPTMADIRGNAYSIVINKLVNYLFAQKTLQEKIKIAQTAAQIATFANAYHLKTYKIFV